ncbi:MAG: F0F1 ATP synthase subunit A [Actinomycetia bacterium]|nr:F0F1 ATP synthase subunit A [Actinomycetes bacterium]
MNFDGLGEHIQELIQTVASGSLWGPITTFTPYILLILILVLVIVFAAKRQLALVPKNRFVGVVEFFVNFSQNEVGYGVMGNAAKKHIPFLTSLFIFIFLANIVGLIPGLKAATGTIGVTLPLAAIAFVYFNFYGIKELGGLHYLLSMAPKGLPIPLAAFIWFLEFFSMVLRLLTLSVRLFANMFAGHLLLGVLAILVSMAFHPLIAIASEGFSVNTISSSVLGLVWLAFLVVMYALEAFVACIQAFVFALLSSVYVFMATNAEH